ncbi:MAG: nitronate monooxygenase, partial [bacterium]
LAKELAREAGIIGINILFAARDFLGIVKTAIDEKIDFITFGAGFSRDIFTIGKDTNTPILPIVSSGKLAKISQELGAAAIVAESSEAGGHLGTLTKSTVELFEEVKAAVPDIPIIPAGGLVNGQDIFRLFKMGANAVQLATRFVLTNECNAAAEYKSLYQKAKKDDIIIIKSPVGLPGRAIKTPFIDKVMTEGKQPIEKCDNCLKVCDRNYCIFEVLKKAQVGKVDEGVVFTGANLYKIKDRSIRPASEIIRELLEELKNLGVDVSEQLHAFMNNMGKYSARPETNMAYG